MTDLLALLPIKLRAVRNHRGYSQKQLARLSGIGEKTISSFETGARIDSIKLSQIINLAAALGLTEAELLMPPAVEVAEPKKRSEPSIRPAPMFRRHRGHTLFRSEDHLVGSLGEARR